MSPTVKLYRNTENGIVEHDVPRGCTPMELGWRGWSGSEPEIVAINYSTHMYRRTGEGWQPWPVLVWLPDNVRAKQDRSAAKAEFLK